MAEAVTHETGIRSFPRPFWVASLYELFERGAYYGVQSVLAVYLAGKVADGGLGFSKSAVGLLQSVVYALTYIIPIFGGALAERFGYRRMLMFAFAMLSLGYFVTGHVSSYGVVFASLVFMAVGSGLFKPIVSGTIARSTTGKNSTLGFGIYYWTINLGAFLSPILVSYLKGFSWSYVFIASSAWCALMLLPNIFIFRDPPKPESTKSIGQTVAEALMVLKNFRFVLMIVIYSGFWILYFQMFNTVLWYLQEFVDTTPIDNILSGIGHFFGRESRITFDVAYVTSVNAGTIICLQMLVSWIVARFKALPTMIAGVGIGTFGFLLLALSGHAAFFFFGVVLFSIGEMTCHPKYYSYIGQIAPKDKVAVYMGYAFLYGIIGSLVGNNLGAALYTHFVEGQAEPSPRSLWMVFFVMGIATMFGLALYNRFLAPKEDGTEGAVPSA
ncbi:MAG: MFS transporter [Candidatus Eisenbacteria sp.]|nr:MFS transporter [Candidatus Eisenbacteria bacterium]